MEGFASREEVEEEFYDVMSSVCSTPLDASLFIVANIESWTRFGNDDALNNGVLEKAINLRESLSLMKTSKLDAPKVSLDEMISIAKERQGSSEKQSSVHALDH